MKKRKHYSEGAYIIKLERELAEFKNKWERLPSEEDINLMIVDNIEYDMEKDRITNVRIRKLAKALHKRIQEGK